MPDQCPVCNDDILSAPMKVPPILIASPLISERELEGMREPAVLIKPALNKSFLQDYQNEDILHCGLRDEIGTQ
jgi:hypothetical protein